MRLELACASEGRAYVAHTAAMIHSAVATNPADELRVHYLHGPDLPARARRKLIGMLAGTRAAIEFHHVGDERVAGLPTRAFTGKATWYRIFLPELLPDVERVLFVDSDTLVLDSIAPLWQLDLDGFYLAAVTNVLEPHYAHRPAELGVEEGTYFNAGVLLMNLALMRRDGCSHALFEHGVEHQPLWRDQDALNVVLGGRRLPLHPRWNCMNIFRFAWADEVFGSEAVAEARANPAIRHFEGPGDNKPWHLLCTRELRELYFEHRRGTPWPRVRRDGLTPANLARRLRG